MLNYYYMYCLTWGSVLLLYAMGFSSLNDLLDPLLLVFFIVTIMYAAVMGYRRRDEFRFKDAELPPIPTFVVLGLLACAALYFFQNGSVPFLNLMRDEYDYSELLNSEASIFSTLSVVGGNFIFVYQLLRLSHKGAPRDVIVLVMALAVLLAATSRSNLMICGIAALIVLISRRRRVVTIGKAFLVILAVLVGLWLFGVAGNIRSGYEWWDSSFIYMLGFFGNRWPGFIPEQFCWFYSYITSPLANLNYAIGATNGSSLDIVNYTYDFLPMVIAKRLPLYEASRTLLQVSYFNVSSVWSDYFADAGFIGIYLGFPIQFLLLRAGHALVKGGRYETLLLVLMSVCVIGSFFTNTFVYPTTSYPIYIALCISIVTMVLRGASSRRSTRGSRLRARV